MNSRHKCVSRCHTVRAQSYKMKMQVLGKCKRTVSFNLHSYTRIHTKIRTPLIIDTRNIIRPEQTSSCASHIPDD